MTETIDKPLNVKQAAEYLGIATSTLYQMVCRKKIPYSKPNNGYVYFRRQDLDNYLNRGRVAADYEVKETAEKFHNRGRR